MVVVAASEDPRAAARDVLALVARAVRLGTQGRTVSAVRVVGLSGCNPNRSATAFTAAGPPRR